MSRSFLATIRAAMVPAPQAYDHDDGPGANHAPASKEDTVSSPKDDAYSEGYQAATERFTAILTDEGIKGDAGRMDAAIDIASKSPSMSVEAVISFVKQNVPVAKSLSAAALANRLTFDDPLGAALGGFLPPAAADGWAEAMDRAAGKKEPSK